MSSSLGASNQHLSTNPELQHQEVANLQLQQSHPNLQLQQSNPNLHLQQSDSEYQETLSEKQQLEDIFEINASIGLERDEENHRIAEHCRLMAETLRRIELILDERDEILRENHLTARSKTYLFQGREKLEHDMTEFKIKSKFMCP